MADDTLPVQAALVARLRADAGVAALVGARIYDQAPQSVAFPFVEIGAVFGQPFEAINLDGWECVVTLDVWSRVPGGREARAVMAATYACLHAAPLAVAGRHLVMVRLADQRDMPDADGASHHGIQRFEIVTHS